MIDLHVHFDGSLPIETVIRLTKKQNRNLPMSSMEAWKACLSAPLSCRSLNEYLERFELPLSLLQTKEAIQEAMEDTIAQFAKQGLWYVEVRFAPQLHCRMGLTQEEVVEAALLGMNQGLLHTDMMAQLILCCMRGSDNKSENLQTIETAGKYLGHGVCACDLAGAEALFPTSDFEDIFRKAAEKNIPFTIHAGEADGAQSIKKAIEFGAVRIGHGVRAIEDQEVLELLKTKKITVECCLTSNLQTKAVQLPQQHPIMKYLHHGIAVTVNTDNTTVSDTNIQKEWELLKKVFEVTVQEEKQMLHNAIEGAFLDEKYKQRLREKL